MSDQTQQNRLGQLLIAVAFILVAAVGIWTTYIRPVVGEPTLWKELPSPIIFALMGLQLLLFPREGIPRRAELFFGLVLLLFGVFAIAHILLSVKG